MPRTSKFPFRADIRGKLVGVASARDTINYLAVGAGRAMIGRFLHRIALEEGIAKRPPLTAVVVHAGPGGRPGDGFREAMIQSGFIDKTDRRSDEDVWKAALKEVHDYWSPRLNDHLEELA